LEDADIDIHALYKNRTSVLFGTTMGEGGMIEEIDKHWTAIGEDNVWAITVSKYPSNAIANHVSRQLNIPGISFVIPTACSAGNYSIGLGYDLIKNDKVDCVIAGGADPFSRIGFTGFGRLYAMSPDVCRPFDKNRKGMMVGEGSGVLILEELNAAKKRNANIYAEILGYGLSCDADHMTAPRVLGIVKVMEKALKNSGTNKKDVDYICAHGTGTPTNDKTECEAINSVFGSASKNICVNSLKSMLGHTMGAASAIEAISCCLSIKHSIIPPTINYETPDPECDIDCVPNKARSKKVKVALNNSFAFGGNNACVVLGKMR
jgi:3-oxoacyl-[acyl-carrier-protein] synthase II